MGPLADEVIHEVHSLLEQQESKSMCCPESLSAAIAGSASLDGMELGLQAVAVPLASFFGVIFIDKLRTSIMSTSPVQGPCHQRPGYHRLCLAVACFRSGNVHPATRSSGLDWEQATCGS